MIESAFHTYFRWNWFKSFWGIISWGTSIATFESLFWKSKLSLFFGDSRRRHGDGLNVQTFSWKLFWKLESQGNFQRVFFYGKCARREKGETVSNYTVYYKVEKYNFFFRVSIISLPPLFFMRCSTRPWCWTATRPAPPPRCPPPPQWWRWRRAGVCEKKKDFDGA